MHTARDFLPSSTPLMCGIKPKKAKGTRGDKFNIHSTCNSSADHACIIIIMVEAKEAEHVG